MGNSNFKALFEAIEHDPPLRAARGDGTGGRCKHPSPIPCIVEVGLQKYKATSSQFPTLVRPEVFFWRTQAGAEVDLLIRNGNQLLPIEIKLGSSIDQYGYAGLRQCMSDLGLKRGWVVNTAEERRMLAPGIEQIPWSAIVAGEVKLF